MAYVNGRWVDDSPMLTGGRGAWGTAPNYSDANWAGSYNISPAARGGQGPYGLVPGNIGIPPNRYQGVQSVYPGLSDLTRQAGNAIGQRMRGLTDEQKEGIQNEAATFGVTSGQPLGQNNNSLSGYRGLRNLGINIGKQQQEALGEYNAFLGANASTVTDPELASRIAQWNAIMNAAPDPRAAAEKQMEAFQQAMARASGGAPSFGSRGVNFPSPGEGYGPGITYRDTRQDPYKSTFDWQQWVAGLPQQDTGMGGLEDWYNTTYGEDLGPIVGEQDTWEDIGVNPDWFGGGGGGYNPADDYSAGGSGYPDNYDYTADWNYPNY